jgi:hypothetical protein
MWPWWESRSVPPHQVYVTKVTFVVAHSRNPPLTPKTGVNSVMTGLGGSLLGRVTIVTSRYEAQASFRTNIPSHVLSNFV